MQTRPDAGDLKVEGLQELSDVLGRQTRQRGGDDGQQLAEALEKSLFELDDRLRGDVALEYGGEHGNESTKGVVLDRRRDQDVGDGIGIVRVRETLQSLNHRAAPATEGVLIQVEVQLLATLEVAVDAGLGDVGGPRDGGERDLVDGLGLEHAGCCMEQRGTPVLLLLVAACSLPNRGH